jgi:hypothetical protein
MKYINIYDTKLLLLDIFESSFLTKLFEDTNVAPVLYKFSQTCDTNNNNDYHFRTVGVVDKSLPSNTVYSVCPRQLQ